jgi:hypothetical protein
MFLKFSDFLLLLIKVEAMKEKPNKLNKTSLGIQQESPIPLIGRTNIDVVINKM